MSLAREKYLKRKRELLGNINIIDNNLGEKKEPNLEKRKTEGKNEENPYECRYDQTLRKNGEHRMEDECKNQGRRGPAEGSSSAAYNHISHRKSDRRHPDDRGHHVDRSHLGEPTRRGKKEPMLDENRSKPILRRNKDNPVCSKSNTPDNAQQWSVRSEKLGRDSSNVSQSAHSFRSVNENTSKQDVQPTKQRDEKGPSPASITSYELLTNLSNIEINDSATLLIYTCKLLLQMCGKENENKVKMNMSLSSVEILREIKNRNRKNLRLLKINILNEVLTYMSLNSGGGGDRVGTNPSEPSLGKHKEIKIEEACIDIENVGISIIIKVIYIKNVKNLLTKCLFQQGKGGARGGDGIGVRKGTKSSDRGSSEDQKGARVLVGGMQIPSEYRTTGGTDGSGSNTYNSLLQENEKKKKKILNQDYAMEYEAKYGEGTQGGNKYSQSDDAKHVNNSSGSNKISYLENLLNEPTAKEKKIKQEKTNILSIIEAPTVIEEMRIKKFQKKDDFVKIICPYLTKKACQKHNKECNKVHFKKIISEHTDVSLGDCSYLDTCRHIETCKFVHYAVDKDDQVVGRNQECVTEKKVDIFSMTDNTYGPQWIRCDLRNFDLSIFNQYVSVVMADPPWDIHMDLPYGTMTDNEMKLLPVQLIQDEGMIFLWVTGRAMELARECLQIWGYKRVEEILWVKTNHLQRIIRTGRTGHWLNHSKEHCLVGIKGNPIVNRNIDCNVIVSEVRETSRKPDEIYSLIERMCPQNLKIELFGRPHNIRSNWITLGNQLNGVVLYHPQIKERYNNIAAQFNMPLCGE
ncbi:mRNA (2'-O-methyladenosine-N6-)-methyltransferase [Plasmodium inui San Antonio 1]|uniref:mRNA (2'-O-methyladenosine-N6-)-methyltransferase n=1 Tax=Plasmodium inui San Antonio 1 TaxID=1237626 RepID=W7A889_9APIC|nr:mRNA (2'-O-methyladenosine-N6-)-methyltransferase [Plasmodium inui San Antonio 1]EUD65359.1 mRNA (2'-O-methyladenosine-N6-)-methyltransferase [Plasmodium inui San Antonio 1]